MLKSKQTQDSEAASKPDFGPEYNNRPGRISLGDKTILDTLVVKKMRSAVFRKLEDLHGMTFADGNWEFFAHRIITASNVIRYPDLYGRVMDKAQVEAMQKDFPLQLQLCESVQERLEKNKEIDQIRSALALG